MRLAALALVALACALTACESNQERDAKIAKVREPQEVAEARRLALARRALSITRESTKVHAIASTVLKGSEGTATAVVTLRNDAAVALRDVPVEIVVKSAAGATIYTNDTPGLGAGLNYAPLVPAHATTTWVDDQVLASTAPAGVAAKIGEGTPVKGPLPALRVLDTRQYVDPTNGPAVEGEVANHSRLAQQEVIVDAVVRQGSRVLAAGRAVLPSVPVGASTRFQLFLAGNPAGGSLEVSAPATTVG